MGKRAKQKSKSVATWTTKDGRVIPIKDLEDTHLINIICMLVRKADQFKLHFALASLDMADRTLRGEMAREAAFEEIDYETKRPAVEVMLRHHDKLSLLLTEARNRKIIGTLKAALEKINDEIATLVMEHDKEKEDSSFVYDPRDDDSPGL